MPPPPYADPVELSCPCTRRPEGPASSDCPWGEGVSVSQSVDETGWSLALTSTTATRGTGFKVAIPPRALGRSTTVTLTELRTAPPAGFVDKSPLYRIEPLDLALCAPGQLSIPESAGASFYFPPSLGIYRGESMDGPFERVGDSYQNAGFFQATLRRGGYYFVGYPDADAQSACK